MDSCNVDDSKDSNNTNCESEFIESVVDIDTVNVTDIEKK
jgi:hypothetical protein